MVIWTSFSLRSGGSERRRECSEGVVVVRVFDLFFMCGKARLMREGGSEGLFIDFKESIVRNRNGSRLTPCSKKNTISRHCSFWLISCIHSFVEWNNSNLQVRFAVGYAL